ncbi:response regulator [Candidatus Woesearchaeota archaeon]|nr:response regulator [Candidatus Woesearchaeota archaeon]
MADDLESVTLRESQGRDEITPVIFSKGQRYKLLYVEDEEQLAKLLPKILTTSGIDFEVEVAINFEEAIAALKGEKNPHVADGNYSGHTNYAAIITDMNFPGGNGAYVAREARNLGFKGRIVIASGQDMEQAKEQTKGITCIGYLNKPVKPKDIIPALEGRY